jgi:hypothetical protein
MMLLVDERDGSVVAEIATEGDARAVLEAWSRDDGSLPDHFSLVELHSRHGALIGTDTTVRVRPLL